MEREISSGAMLGIVLLALAAVIGLGFGVFAIAKGVANEGTVGVQDSLGTVSDQAFLDYDQKVVTGTQAFSALKTFEGKPYALFYSTNALAKSVATDKGVHPDHAGKITIASIGETGATQPYVNYNALAKEAPKSKNGAYEITGLQTTGGNIAFDNVTVGMSKSGNTEYIPSASKFEAKVVKDPGGNYIGLVFKEVAK